MPFPVHVDSFLMSIIGPFVFSYREVLYDVTLVVVLARQCNIGTELAAVECTTCHNRWFPSGGFESTTV